MLKTFKHFYFSDTIVLFNFSQSSWALSTTAPACRSSLYEAVIYSQGQIVLSGTLSVRDILVFTAGCVVVEARDAAKHLPVHRTAPQQEAPGLKYQSCCC